MLAGYGKFNGICFVAVKGYSGIFAYKLIVLLMDGINYK